MYYSFALVGHRGTCLRPLHIFALLFALELEEEEKKPRTKKICATKIPVLLYRLEISAIFAQHNTFVIMQDDHFQFD